MKRIISSGNWILPVALAMVLLLACSLISGNRYEYWKGDIPNTYYCLNMWGERALKVTGKPFMCVKYNPVNHEILDIEFGLSEVVQEHLPTPSGDPAAPEPTLAAENISYYKKLNLKSPVVLLLNWPVATANGAITNGVQSFKVQHTMPREEYNFIYTSLQMEGDVKNLDDATFLGRESEINAFKLLKH